MTVITKIDLGRSSARQTEKVLPREAATNASVPFSEDVKQIMDG